MNLSISNEIRYQLEMLSLHKTNGFLKKQKYLKTVSKTAISRKKKKNKLPNHPTLVHRTFPPPIPISALDRCYFLVLVTTWWPGPGMLD